MFSFLTPGFFDALVWLAIVVSVAVAIVRLVSDFRRGPRWTESEPSEPPANEHQDMGDETNRSDKA